MGKEHDLRQVDEIGRRFGMDHQTRREFGNYLELCKRSGDYGSAPGGNYTEAELAAKAEEFLGALGTPGSKRE